jgi:hypothetical protein
MESEMAKRTQEWSLEESFASALDSIIGGWIAKAELEGLDISPLDEARLVASGERLAEEMTRAIEMARICTAGGLMPPGLTLNG